MNEIPCEDFYSQALSRKRALEDGLIMNMDMWASELGYRFPVACSVEVWNRVAPARANTDVTSDDRRRIRLLLKALRTQIRALQHESDRVDFCADLFIPHQRHQRFWFVAFCGPGDKYEPTLTIMTRAEAEGVVDGS
jgi:hypothetical protein